MWAFFKKNFFLVLILFLTFLLRIPSLFEPYWYGDEGIYLTLGMGVKNGLILYKDIFDNKPPMIYLLAAFAGNLFWLRFFLLFSVIFSLILFEKLTKIFLFKNSFGQKISLVIFFLLINIPLIEGNIANAEIFQILPTLAVAYLLFRNKEPTDKELFFAGFFSSITILFKIPAVLIFFSFILFPLFLILLGQKNLSKIKSWLFYFFSGLILPIIPLFLYFIYHHCFQEFFKATFLLNLGYLSSWKTGSHQFSLLKSDLLQRFFLFGLVLIFLFSQTKRFSSKWDFFLLGWFFSSLLSALLSNRPYAHYLIQIVPPFCFLVGRLIDANKFSRSLIILAIFLLSFITIKNKYWVYSIFPYYQNFFNFVQGKKTKTEYFSFFDRKVPSIYQVSLYLKTHTRTTEKIFVWADEPCIYPLSQRLPFHRFVVAYHIIDFKKTGEVEKKLFQNPPAAIVLERTKKESFPQLETILNTKYYLAQNISDFEIYRLQK